MAARATELGGHAPDSAAAAAVVAAEAAAEMMAASWSGLLPAMEPKTFCCGKAAAAAAVVARLMGSRSAADAGRLCWKDDAAPGDPGAPPASGVPARESPPCPCREPAAASPAADAAWCREWVEMVVWVGEGGGCAWSGCCWPSDEVSSTSKPCSDLRTWAVWYGSTA